MKKKSNVSQAITDQAEVEIIENNIETQKGLSVIDEDREAAITREIAIQQAEKYLDGQEYDLERITSELKAHMNVATQAAIEIGRRLIAVKMVEKHGAFINWLESNFSFSPRYAQYLMSVADKLEKRPELGSLAKGGITKARVLLDMPEEYHEEYVKEGTIDGKPLDELHTMTRDELIKLNKKLKANLNKQVEEETKSLKAEKEALIYENKRLKKFEPTEDSTPEWCIEKANEISQAALRIDTLARQLRSDERLRGDIVTQAKIDVSIQMAERTLDQLVRDLLSTDDLME